jgi:hypothetical protein
MFALLTSAVAAYSLLSSKGANEPVRRVASWVAAFVSVVVALAVTMAFGIPVLQQLRNPNILWDGLWLQ